MLQDIKVTGIDRDKGAITNARANLEWAKFVKNNYFISVGDSRQFNFKDADGMVTEPDMGATLKKEPGEGQLRQTLERYELLIIDVLNNLKKNVHGRFVFTAPLISKKSKRISCNIGQILYKTGLKLVEGFPIQDYRKNQFVGRDIFVLEKI